MIYNFEYSNFHNREKALTYLEEKKFTRVIDVGATANGWSNRFLTHYVDIHEWPNTRHIPFLGNICLYSTWEPILRDVEENGLFDFAICTHALEDISSPQFVSEMLTRVAKEGFIAVPSKNVELSRHVNGPYYGHIHHRWIYNKEGDEFVAYPKLNFIEHSNFDSITQAFDSSINELCFFWKGDFKFNIVNSDYMGPNVEAVQQYFKGLTLN